MQLIHDLAPAASNLAAGHPASMIVTVSIGGVAEKNATTFATRHNRPMKDATAGLVPAGRSLTSYLAKNFDTCSATTGLAPVERSLVSYQTIQ